MLRRILSTFKFAIVFNAIVTMIKIVGGIISGSIALLADGLDSSLNVLTLGVTRRYYYRARKPPDETHPYGHYRYEAYASIIVLLIMTILGTTIVIVSFHDFLSGVESEKIGMEAIPFAALSLIVNICVYSMFMVEDSIALKTERRHISVDVFESIIVMIGVVLASFISKMWDLLASILITVIIFFNVYASMKELQAFIMDVSPDKDVLDRIVNIILSTNGVEDIHALRARKIGKKIFVDLHLIVKKGTPIERAHYIADLVEENLKKEFNDDIDVLIHLEPEGHSEEKSSSLEK